MVQAWIGIVALASEYGLRASISKKHDDLGTIVSMTVGQHEAECQAKLPGEQVDLDRQTSSTPRQKDFRQPFFRAVTTC